ncbi:MAG: class I SAM-dependent methyltransferase [Bacteroidales bacterium]|nr:class I SAM-dependent methyltransferase [Bacteroidales bacterium]HOY37835.1 class I SAM-dependent methyltransferase [Bacteroidales bacterium]HQP05285.1 class I SAM-dependent methyltransferase [Bacteroidales bacterium]
MEEINYNKVSKMYKVRSTLAGDHSVLIGSNDEVSLRSDILLDYLTKRNLLWYLNPQPSDIILDFGCGIGRLSFLLQSKCKRMIGVDPSEELIEIASRRNNCNNVEFRKIDFVYAPIELEAHVDKIFTVGVMYHISEEDLILRLKNFGALLSENGRLVFIEHVSPTDRILGGVGVQRSMNTWMRLLTESGFSVKLSKPIIRMPSFSIAYWKKLKLTRNWLLPCFFWLEKLSINRKPRLAEYYYYIFVCEKIRN